ncbi:MAG TPA: serine/threonine-protein kinase [Polyangiaceae bacterium]|nr:serine/threonine-protein kinase [Polyangiaceae bacterium]
MDEATVIPPGTLLLGKLRVIRLLGTGGMGAVYEVEHELTKHRRAMKLLHGPMARLPSVVQRFLREASAAGRIGNPHIVETFDAGQLESGEPYIVMELLKGSSLEHLLREKQQLPVFEATEIIRQACDGIQTAHDAGIIHRDIKPENLFLIDHERIYVKILDFGISKFDPTRTGNFNLTNEGTALGTPYYMPPEQARGETSLDVRADVYALGVVLYECLSGRKPFVAETLPHLAVLIHEGKYTPLAQLRPDVPAALGALIARAMSTNPEQRFATARAMREALDLIDPGLLQTRHSPHGSYVSARSEFPHAATALGATQPTSSGATEAAGTGAGVELAAKPASGRMLLWAVGALIVLGIAAGIVAKMAAPTSIGKELVEASDGRVNATAQPVPSAPAPESSANEGPIVTVASAPSAPAAPPVSASASAARAVPGRGAAPSGSAPKGASTSRAREHGLAEENPF